MEPITKAKADLYLYMLEPDAGLEGPPLTLDQLAKRDGFAIPPNPWIPGSGTKHAENQDVIERERDLVKRESESSAARSKLSLLRYLRSRLAVGETAAEVIEFAARHDLRTSNSLRSVAMEFGL
jgi:hypothetical protein